MLGAAPAFHNGLFILQFPLLLSFACLWALGRPIERRAALAFALVLVATTAAFLVPSQPFRLGDFPFYLHSSFHLYAASCTALLCALASVFRFTPKAAAGLGVLLVAMALPVLPQLVHGRDFLFAELPYLDRIQELGSIPRELARGNWWPATLTYSPALWLLPLGLGGLLWRLRRDSSNASLYFLGQALVGSFLLLQTFRLHYFGEFALILPLCRLIDDARELRPAFFASRPRRLALGVLVTAPLLVCLLGLKYEYWARRRHQRRVQAGATRLRGARRRVPQGARHRPRRARRRASHPLSLRLRGDRQQLPHHAQHVEKAALSDALLDGSAAGVLRDAPYVRYILVKRADNLLDPGRQCGLQCPENAGLRRELLQDGPAARGPAAAERALREPGGQGRALRPVVRSGAALKPA